jgi:hypothetical protein
MSQSMKRRTFDHEKAMEEITAHLAEFPPGADIWHVEEGSWVERYPLPEITVENLVYVLTLVERDAAEPYPYTSQLRWEIEGSIRNAFKAGYEAGQTGKLRYLRAVLDGQVDDQLSFLEADELISVLLADIDGPFDGVEVDEGEADVQ